MDDSTLELKGLEDLVKALNQKAPVIRIGIMGDHNARKDGSTTNSEVGAAHEFGTSKMAKRSFLRVPISDNLNNKMEESHMFNKEQMRDVIKNKDITPWLKTVGVIAFSIVQEGFASNGYGKWAPYKDPNYKNKTGMKLVNDTDLRDSITWDISK